MVVAMQKGSRFLLAPNLPLLKDDLMRAVTIQFQQLEKGTTKDQAAWTHGLAFPPTTRSM